MFVVNMPFIYGVLKLVLFRGFEEWLVLMVTWARKRQIMGSKIIPVNIKKYSKL